MDDRTKSEAALRVNDDEEDAVETVRKTRRDTPPMTDAEEISAEGGPELRDIAMPDGVDRPDGSRKA